MGSRQYSLVKGERPRIKVQWQGLYNKTDVYFDDQLLGSFTTRKALKIGKGFNLDDGSTLYVNLKPGQGLTVLYNARPVPGSATVFEKRWREAYMLTIAIGILGLWGGIAIEVFQIEVLQELGFGMHTALLGGALLALGMWGKQIAAIPFPIAAILFLADGVIPFITVAQRGQIPSIAALLVRVYIAFLMWRGYAAVQMLKDSEPDYPHTESFDLS